MPTICGQCYKLKVWDSERGQWWCSNCDPTPTKVEGKFPLEASKNVDRHETKDDKGG